MNEDSENWQGYEWTALSVTTIGTLLVSVQETALLIALPEILTHLQTDFLTIMWAILSFMLVTTALVPVVGRLADMFGRKNLYNAGFAIFTLGISSLRPISTPVPWLGFCALSHCPGCWRCNALRKWCGHSDGCLS